MFFVQDSNISIANPMEVLMPCTKPSKLCYAVLLQSAWCAFFTVSYKKQCRYEHVLNDDHIVITTSFFFLPLLINTCLYVHMAIIARKQVGGRLQHLMSTIGLHYHGLLPHYAYMHTFFHRKPFTHIRQGCIAVAIVYMIAKMQCHCMSHDGCGIRNL